MDIRSSASIPPVDSTTEPDVDTVSLPEVDTFSFRAVKRQLNIAGSDDPTSPKLQPLSPVAHPEGNISARSVTRLEPFFYSETNKPNKLIPWGSAFECIYHSLLKERHSEIEAQLNALSDIQIKSLPIINPPSQLLSKYETPDSLFDLASTAGETGHIFFRVLFDRLTSEELRVALSESINGNLTLLYFACCLMDEPLFKQLEDKLDKQTLLEMVTRPLNNQAPPLACACLFSNSTYLFDTVIEQNKELVVKLLKGGPDIDQSLLQFLCSDESYCLNPDKHHYRIQHLLAGLNKQDRFEAVGFTGKSNQSPLLWACKKDDFQVVTILTESLDDDQRAKLLTAGAKTGNSLVQKCLEFNRIDEVTKLCMSIRDPLWRFKALSICTSEGHSLFKLRIIMGLFNHTKKIEGQIYMAKYLLQGMNDSQREQLIAGDRRIWDQAIDHKHLTMCGQQAGKDMISCSHLHTLTQQEQTPIGDAINRKNMHLAKLFWEQIADPELQTKLLLYKPKNQTALLHDMLDNEDQWQGFKIRLKNTRCQIVHDLFATELYTHALITGRVDDAGDYYREITDSKLIDGLIEYFGKDLLFDLCKNGKTIPDLFFNKQNPAQCTESVIHLLGYSLDNQEPITANLSQLFRLQKKAGNKHAFVTWATSPQQGKQCPLTTALSQFAIAHGKINDPYRRKHTERQACFNQQIFQGMMSMMSEEQIKAFIISLQDKSSKLIHLLGYKDIIATTVDTLGESGRAFLEQINPVNGGNLLHVLFESSSIDYRDIQLNDIMKTVEWLDETYGLSPFLQSRLENDGSTPLHILLATANRAMKRRGNISPIVQKHILKYLCQPIAEGILLTELLKLKDNNGRTPLHKFFSCKESNEEIGKLLIQELGHGTFYELMHIKDKQDITVMDHLSKLHEDLYDNYNAIFQKLPAGLKVQPSGFDASESKAVA